jgi:hypothetical protein
MAQLKKSPIIKIQPFIIQNAAGKADMDLVASHQKPCRVSREREKPAP